MMMIGRSYCFKKSGGIFAILTIESLTTFY